MVACKISEPRNSTFMTWKMKKREEKQKKKTIVATSFAKGRNQKNHSETLFSLFKNYIYTKYIKGDNPQDTLEILIDTIDKNDVCAE